MRGRWMLVQSRCRSSRLSAFVSAVLVALSLVPAATTGDWGSGPSCRSGRRAVHVGPTLAVLASLRGGSESNAQEEPGQGEQQTSYAPLTPVAPSAVALQEELGRVTKQWVEGRGRRDAPSPERDLQQEIDNVIAKWTQTAIATPRIVVQEPRRQASSSATPVPSRPTPQGMGRLSDTDNVWFGEGGVSVRRGLTSPSPVYETASDGGDRDGEDETGYSSAGGRADTHDAGVDGAGQAASQLLDGGQEFTRESGDDERGDENSVASQDVRPGSPASSPATAVGERQVPGGIDDQLVRSSAALQALSVQLQSRALVEMWVDPTGDSLFEALAQQLYAMEPSSRANLEADGYEFDEPPEPVDGQPVWRFGRAAWRCRLEIVSFMKDVTRFSDAQWRGIEGAQRGSYLEKLSQAGTPGGAREIEAASEIYRRDITCFHVSPSGLTWSVTRHSASSDESAVANNGKETADMFYLVECGGGYWSAVPEGLMSVDAGVVYQPRPASYDEQSMASPSVTASREVSGVSLQDEEAKINNVSSVVKEQFTTPRTLRTFTSADVAVGGVGENSTVTWKRPQQVAYVDSVKQSFLGGVDGARSATSRIANTPRQQASDVSTPRRRSSSTTAPGDQHWPILPPPTPSKESEGANAREESELVAGAVEGGAASFWSASGKLMKSEWEDSDEERELAERFFEETIALASPRPPATQAASPNSAGAPAGVATVMAGVPAQSPVAQRAAGDQGANVSGLERALQELAVRDDTRAEQLLQMQQQTGSLTAALVQMINATQAAQTSEMSKGMAAMQRDVEEKLSQMQQQQRELALQQQDTLERSIRLRQEEEAAEEQARLAVEAARERREQDEVQRAKEERRHKALQKQRKQKGRAATSVVADWGSPLTEDMGEEGGGGDGDLHDSNSAREEREKGGRNGVKKSKSKRRRAKKPKSLEKWTQADDDKLSSVLLSEFPAKHPSMAVRSHSTFQHVAPIAPYHAFPHGTSYGPYASAQPEPATMFGVAAEMGPQRWYNDGAPDPRQTHSAGVVTREASHSQTGLRAGPASPYGQQELAAGGGWWGKAPWDHEAIQPEPQRWAELPVLDAEPRGQGGGGSGGSLEAQAQRMKEEAAAAMRRVQGAEKALAQVREDAARKLEHAQSLAQELQKIVALQTQMSTAQEHMSRLRKQEALLSQRLFAANSGQPLHPLPADRAGALTGQRVEVGGSGAVEQESGRGDLEEMMTTILETLDATQRRSSDVQEQLSAAKARMSLEPAAAGGIGTGAGETSQGPRLLRPSQDDRAFRAPRPAPPVGAAAATTSTAGGGAVGGGGAGSADAGAGQGWRVESVDLDGEGGAGGVGSAGLGWRGESVDVDAALASKLSHAVPFSPYGSYPSTFARYSRPRHVVDEWEDGPAGLGVAARASQLRKREGRSAGKSRRGVEKGASSREAVAAVLGAAGLSRYEKTLVRGGWDSLSRMRMVTEADLVELGIKKGHARALVQSLSALLA